MFERYTEKARRAVFFARYEASQFGSPEIDTEHLLLGLLRETRALRLKLESSGTSADKLRESRVENNLRRETPYFRRSSCQQCVQASFGVRGG
jgi:ATP-dependent Clp protease ATP-binding subunit ClpC